MIMTLDEAKQLISKQERARYVEWVLEGVRDYFRRYEAGDRRVHSKRSRSSLINDHIIDRVYRGFGEISGARLFRRRGRYLLSVRDTFLGSFKKLDKAMRVHGIPTGQALAFVGQLPRFDMPPSVTHLILGYRLNELQTDCEGVYIVCPNGEDIAWKWRIGGPQVVELPMDPAVPSAARMPGVPRRAKLKKDISADDQGENAADN